MQNLINNIFIDVKNVINSNVYKIESLWIQNVLDSIRCRFSTHDILMLKCKQNIRYQQHTHIIHQYLYCCKTVSSSDSKDAFLNVSVLDTVSTVE